MITSQERRMEQEESLEQKGSMEQEGSKVSIGILSTETFKEFKIRLLLRLKGNYLKPIYTEMYTKRHWTKWLQIITKQLHEYEINF